MSTVRSNEQLLFLLKLVDVNQVETERRNVNVRHKIWKGIAEKLNRLSANGAEKDGDGWKRCFKTWRLGVGPDYKTKMQELIKSVPSDGNYLIKVSDDEDELKSNELNSNKTDNPIEKQKGLLHELVLKHKMLLLSTAHDEPLKARLWQNIADQLNAIPEAPALTPLQWKESVDLDKYRTKRGRKPKKTSNSKDHESNVSYASYDETTEASTSSQNQTKTQTAKSNEFSESHKYVKEKVGKRLEESDNDCESITENESTCFEDDEDADLAYEPRSKRFRPSPLFKNFRFSNRMVCAVEQLKEDVQSVHNSLKETTDSLNSIRNVLERQCDQQEEFNSLLKRSTQLLKVLVEFKIGKRTSITKRNFQINNEREDI